MPQVVSFNANDAKFKNIIKRVKPFRDLNTGELKRIINVLKRERYKKDDVVVKEGQPGSAVYIVASGKFQLLMMDRHVTYFSPGDSFGEIALVDNHPRMGTIIASQTAELFRLERRILDDPDKVPTDISKKIYQGFARMISSYLREGSTLYDTMDVLLIQDGGCAPGYNPVTAFITEHLSRMDRNIFIAAEGFKSVVSNLTSDIAISCMIRRCIKKLNIFQV